MCGAILGAWATMVVSRLSNCQPAACTRSWRCAAGASNPRPELGRRNGEVAADVAKACGAEQRVGDRVGQCIGIGMAEQTMGVRDGDPPRMRPAGDELMGVPALADAQPEVVCGHGGIVRRPPCRPRAAESAAMRFARLPLLCAAVRSAPGAPAHRPRALGRRGAGTHIGVLQVLEEQQIPIDIVVGTSMGAVVGGAYVAGRSPRELAALVRQADWAAILADRPARERLAFRRRGTTSLCPRASSSGCC